MNIIINYENLLFLATMFLVLLTIITIAIYSTYFWWFEEYIPTRINNIILFILGFLNFSIEIFICYDINKLHKLNDLNYNKYINIDAVLACAYKRNQL